MTSSIISLVVAIVAAVPLVVGIVADAYAGTK